MKYINLSEIAPYNEYDHACNGGYFKCPYCGEQLYVSKAENGDVSDCDCGKEFIFLN